MIKKKNSEFFIAHGRVFCGFVSRVSIAISNTLLKMSNEINKTNNLTEILKVC